MENRLKELAIALREAGEKKMTIDPIFDKIDNDVELAYKVQQVNTLHKLNQGHRIVGKKIGLTSLAVQQQFGIDQPDFGILFEDMEVLNRLSLSISEVVQPKVEAEIAFVMAEDLDYDKLTIIDIMSAIDYALPAIEIVGSRVENWNIKIADTIADNASASHYVVGHTPRTLDEFDVVNCRMEMTINNQLMSEGSGVNCMGSPLNAVLWLANTMAKNGTPLEAGELILSGSLGKMANVNAGDKVEATFEGLGNVSVTFT